MEHGSGTETDLIQQRQPRENENAKRECDRKRTELRKGMEKECTFIVAVIVLLHERLSHHRSRVDESLRSLRIGASVNAPLEFINESVLREKKKKNKK